MTTHRFLAITHSDGSYHAANDYEPKKPIESKSIHAALQFHEKDHQIATDILSSLRKNHPEVEAFQDSRVYFYQYVLLKEDDMIEEERFEIVERYYLCTKTWFGEEEFLCEEGHSRCFIEEALRMTKEEAVSVVSKNGDHWELAEFVLMRIKDEEVKETNFLLLSEKKEFAIQFEDGLYFAGSPYGNLKLETRDIFESTKLSSIDVNEVVQKIKETAEEDSPRKRPSVCELLLIPSLNAGKKYNRKNYTEQVRYYAVCSVGTLVEKTYNKKHYREDYNQQYTQVDLETAYYYDTEQYEYTTAIPKTQLSYEEADELLQDRNEKLADQLEHRIVEVTILTKK